MKKLVELHDATKRVIEHQRLVGAGMDRLDQRLDQVQPTVRVQAQVEHVGLLVRKVEVKSA